MSRSPAAEAGPRTDALGDPLPAGAIARLGTVRFRHGGGIHFVAFTPDGKRLVSQGNDGVRVWDAATGAELRSLTLPDGLTWGATDLSADGKLVAATSAGQGLANPLRLWEVDSGKVVATLGKGFWMHVRLSPDGKWLAASSGLANVEVWDVAARKKLRSWKAHKFQVWSVAFSADSRKLLTSGTEGTVRLWDAATGRQLQEFTPTAWKPGTTGPVGPAALSPDGHLLALIEPSEKQGPAPAAGGWKARISLRETTTGKQTGQLFCPSREVRPGYVPSFSGLAFTPDGKQLVTGGPDELVRVWDLATGRESRRLSADLPSPRLLALSKNGEQLAFATGSTAIQIMDLSGGKKRSPSSIPHMAVEEVILTSDCRTAVTGSAEGALRLWDVASGRPRHSLGGPDQAILKAALTRDQRALIAVAKDNHLHAWDLVTGEERWRAKLETTIPQQGLQAMVLAPDGKTVALVYPERTIRLLEAASGKERRRLEVPQWVWGVAFTPDGRSLTSWSGDRKVRVWDVESGRCLREYALPYDLGMGQPFLPADGTGPSFYQAAVSPDGRLLAMAVMEMPRVDAAQQHYLVLKDLLTGRNIRRDKLPSDPGILAFSADGLTLAWSGHLQDWSIHLLEVASGRERRRLPGHRGQGTALSFSAHGQGLISGSIDTTALVWDLRSRFDPGEPSAALTAAELETLWADLAAEDAARAYRAIRKLAAAPNSTIPFLRKRLRPVPALDEKRLARLIADLESDDFAIRQKAISELEKLGERALPAYRKAIEGRPPIETRRRLEDLLEKAGPAWWDVSGERLRALRAVEALELAGTQEAQEVLAILAGGAAGARLTEQAKASLGRLADLRR